MIKQFRVFIFIGLLLTGGGLRSFGQSGPPMPPMPPGPPAPGIIAGGAYAAAPPSPGGGVPPGTNPPSVYSHKAYSYTNGELWVELITVSNSWFFLNVHNTQSNRYYHLCSRDILSTNSPWKVETDFYGNTNQTNVTAVSVPQADRLLVFFWAASGEDSDLDGLPDWYEQLFSFTSATNEDTGSIGILDTERDLAGDGLTVYEKFRSGKNPFVFEIPPPPASVKVTYFSTNATLSWAATRGSPTEYAVERFNPTNATFVEIGRTNILSFVDNALPANSTPAYRVRAIYGAGTGGGGASTGYGGGVASTDLGPFPGAAAVVRGTNSALYVAISAMPTNVVAIRVNKGMGAAGFPKFDFYNPIWSTNQYLPNRTFFSASSTNSYFDIAIGQFTNGLYRIPGSEVPFYAYYDFTIQARDAAGNLSRLLRSQPFNPTWSYLKNLLRVSAGQSGLFSYQFQMGGSSSITMSFRSKPRNQAINRQLIFNLKQVKATGRKPLKSSTISCSATHGNTGEFVSKLAFIQACISVMRLIPMVRETLNLKSNDHISQLSSVANPLEFEL